MVKIKVSGNFNNMDRFLLRIKRGEMFRTLNRAGEDGTRALAAYTPVDSGITADSWGYNIRETRQGVTIEWTNSNINKGVAIAILIQYGHGTGTGGYVQARDFINPAMMPIFKNILDTVWKEITK